jgi:hypothetical protein
VQYAEEPLAQHRVVYERDHKRLRELTEPRLFETPYQSPQLLLWELRPGDWRVALQLPESAARRRATSEAVQLPLFAPQPDAPFAR